MANAANGVHAVLFRGLVEKGIPSKVGLDEPGRRFSREHLSRVACSSRVTAVGRAEWICSPLCLLGYCCERDWVCLAFFRWVSAAF